MSLPNYKSTPGTTNLARVACMIFGPCTGVLCALLTKEVTPSALMHNVMTFIANYRERRPCPINREQEQLVRGGNFSEFDITLLYTLLRNVSTFPPHSSNWGNNPNQGDRSVSANIERIRLIRNGYEHSSNKSLSDSAFNAKCQDIFTIIQELESYMGSDTIYQDAVTHIKTCSMDPEQEAKYIHQLHDVNIKLDCVLDEINKTRNATLHQSLRALYERDILKWKEEDRVFLETHNFPVMLEQVRQEPFVTFVGAPGSGKTVTARHIALILQKEGYDILPIIDVHNIENYCSTVIPQVFVIDDVIGVFGLNELALNVIHKYRDRILNPLNNKTKILMTCREAVFRNEMLSSSVLVKREHVVHLQSKNNALNDEDKQNLLEKYKLDRDLLTLDNLASSSNMFPFLCKLFSSKNMKVYGPTFFISPVPCILKELNSLKKENKYQYASLVLLMTNRNKLSDKILDKDSNETWTKKKREKQFGEMKCNILRKCKVPSTTDNFQLIDALSEMEGTYTRKCGSEFTLIHDSMFEIIAFHFGCQFPELILQYMSSSYIANYIKINKNKNKTRKRQIECEKDIACKDDKRIEIVYERNNNEPRRKKNICKEDDACEDNTLIEIVYERDKNNVRKSETECEEQNACDENKLTEIASERETTIDLCIQLHESTYPMLSERLFKDIQKGEFFKVFGNEALKCPSVLQAFIAVLKEKSYDNLYNLLMKELKNASKIRKWRFGLEDYGVEEEKYMCKKTGAHRFLIDERMIKHRYRNLCLDRSSVRGIKWIIFFGHNQILQYILNRMIQEKGNVNDLFQNCFNKCHHPNSDIGQGDSEEDSPLNLSMIGELDKKVDFLGEEHLTKIDKDAKTGSYMNSNTDIDTYSDTENDPDIDTDSDLYSETDSDIFSETDSDTDREKKSKREKAIEIYKEPVIVEQCRLLCLGCYSGDLSTVEILLNNVNTDALNNTVWPTTCLYNDNNPLIIASKYGFLDIVEKLLKVGADLNICVDNKTPLTVACEKKHHIIAMLLLKTGANVNPKDVKVPLHWACEKGDIFLVEKLIEAGADVNLDTPLVVACKKAHLDIVKMLINAGADVNLAKYNKTPLLVACKKGHLSVVKELITAGVDVNINDRKKTPLMAACDGGYFKILKLLMMSGAKVYPEDKVQNTIKFSCYWKHLNVVKKLIKLNPNEENSGLFIAECDRGPLCIANKMNKGREDVSMKNEDMTPLSAACYSVNLHAVKEHIKMGADANLRTEFISPLQIACYEGHSSRVKELYNAEFNDNLAYCVKKAVLGACFFGHLDVIKELMACQLEVNLTYEKETPLTTASYMGHLHIVKELIKAGADVNLKDGDKTPLTAACYRSHINIVGELIKEGADINLMDKEKTPLTTACYMGNWILVQELIKLGADVNLPDFSKTPLTTACYGGHRLVVHTLVEARADVNLSDGCKTPLQIAFELKYMDLIEELIKAEAIFNIENKYTALASVDRFFDWKYSNIIKILIKLGTNINECCGDRTPLTAACYAGIWCAVKSLIKAGADVNLSDGKNTPLTAACEKDHRDVAHELIKAGADVNLSDGKNTPLTAACEKDHWNVAQELIKAKADVNLSDGKHTPLTAACRKGHWSVVEELIKANADVNLHDGKKTPLTTACGTDFPCELVVEELIKAGAAINLSDGEITPIQAAWGKKNWHVIKILIGAGVSFDGLNLVKSSLLNAIKEGNCNLVKELIERGADLWLSDKDGKNNIIGLFVVDANDLFDS